MGLDFVGAEAHWGYSGFMRFREKLAKEINMDLMAMEGFSYSKKGIPWKNSDPIIPLLNHSDCDGILTPKQCANIAPRLLELIKNWPDNDFDKIQATLLAEGMMDCANSGDPLEFC